MDGLSISEQFSKLSNYIKHGKTFVLFVFWQKVRILQFKSMLSDLCCHDDVFSCSVEHKSFCLVSMNSSKILRSNIRIYIICCSS